MMAPKQDGHPDTNIVRPRHLSNIQILRGIAAIMVLVYHIGNELEDRGFQGDFSGVGSGSAGVDIFFVISGFIMVHSSAKAFGKVGAPALFLSRRAIRLVPLYWMVTTLCVAATLWQARPVGVSTQTLRWFAASYAFLFYPHGNAGDFPLYVQGWTLNFEMFFYLCFALALPLRRCLALWLLSAGFLSLTTLAMITTLPWPVDRWADSNIVEFVLGLALAELYARDYRLPLAGALMLAAVGFAVFYLTIGSVDDWLPYRGFVWGPPALAVVAAAALYRPRGNRGRVRAAFEALGDASYALYLVHYGFFVVLGNVLSKFTDVPSLPLILYCLMCFVGAITLAFFIYYLVERPVTRSLNNVLDLSRRWSTLTAGLEPKN